MTSRPRRNAGAPTRAGIAYSKLREDILGGRFTPGQQLRFAEMVDLYQCSIGALREALHLLASTGLVESEAQLGFRVVSVSADDLVDLTTARSEIEVLALKYAIRDGDVNWEAKAVAAHHLLERAPQFSDAEKGIFTEEWAVAHAAFHQALLNGCSNRRILSTALSLRDSAELYRRWSVPLGHDLGRNIAGEHRAILDATIRRDRDEAGKLLASHIQHTTKSLLTVLQNESSSKEKVATPS
ncbi:GntR family transcriptional regulator [Rhodococcus ruber]|uniref:GntR family transcriptional regulator n=1 Tax=Rhodococcus ruber TaxID=1830 RepID=A0ABT4ML82_9NOCA|nr:GntR family transcriptional regulator [Rhodococcus ruber]MCZ4521757.1 GntR family transcriptional regulator [Rhodococcus ruber]